MGGKVRGARPTYQIPKASGGNRGCNCFALAIAMTKIRYSCVTPASKHQTELESASQYL